MNPSDPITQLPGDVAGMCGQLFMDYLPALAIMLACVFAGLLLIWAIKELT